MGDLKLFQIDNGVAVELQGAALALERPLQMLIERNMEVLFGARFVASEHSTGKKHGGRIDSLGPLMILGSDCAPPDPAHQDEEPQLPERILSSLSLPPEQSALAHCVGEI